ncbi:MAG TPA: 30S ribosome-binding factor RbfA, partial [Gemmatimonadaceae bacterium]
VDVTADLRYARIYVSIMGTDAERQTTFEGLQSLAPQLRSRIAKALRLRFAPELEFRNDPTPERAARIETLLAQLRENQPPSDDEAGR